MQIAIAQDGEGEFLMSDELIRERDFYRAKLKETNARVKSLEYDNAELVKRDQDLSKRLAENANRGTYRPRPKRFN